MFYALLLERNSEIFKNLIENSNVNIVYLRYSDFVVCIVSDILFFTLSNIHFVNIYTGSENLIKDASIEFDEKDDIISELTIGNNSNYIISLKSHLNVWVYENLSTEGFYWKLVNRNNSENTRNRNYFDLYYKTYPVVVEDRNKFFDSPIQIQHGPVIMCSLELKSLPIPYIFIKELFRDIIEINFFELGLKEGENSHDLYLYYKDKAHFDSEETGRIVDTISSSMKDNIQNYIFPRATKELEFPTKKYLTLLPNGMYQLNLKLPNIINPYSFDHELYANFSSLENLYIFWTKVKEKKVKVSIDHNDYAYVFYSTNDLMKAIEMENYMRISKSLEKPDFKISLKIVKDSKSENAFYNNSLMMYMEFVVSSNRNEENFT